MYIYKLETIKDNINPNIVRIIQENFNNYEIVVNPDRIILKDDEKCIVASIYLTNYVNS